MAEQWPVSQAVPMRLEQPSTALLFATWRYAAASDPWTVSVDFGQGNVWVLGRDLLADGLKRPCGLGDVALRPRRGRLFIALSNDDGRALPSAKARHVAEFLHATYGWIAAGDESAYVDLDATAGRLLYGGGAR